MHNKPVIIFDLDGTLIDSAEAIACSVNAMLEAFGRAPLTVDVVGGFMGDGVEPVVDRALAVERSAAPVDRAAALRLFLDHHDEHAAGHIVKYAGADLLLSELTSEGYALALCTNKIERLTTPLLSQLGWTRWFSNVVCGDTLTVRKPDPRVLRYAWERSGRDGAVFVGDTHVDLATAIAAAIPLIFIDHGHRDPGLDLSGHVLVSDFAGVREAAAAIHAERSRPSSQPRNDAS